MVHTMPNVTKISEVKGATPHPADDESIDPSMVILMLIVPFGLVGNLISLVTIFHSRLRKVNREKTKASGDLFAHLLLVFIGVLLKMAATGC